MSNNTEVISEVVSVEKEEAIAKRKSFEAACVTSGNVWGHSEVGVEAKKAAMAMLSTKTGLYARIPITCKSTECPYHLSCELLKYNLAPYGEKCAYETGLIEVNYMRYMEEFNLDEASYSDITMVKELVNAEVMIERSLALLSQEGLAIEQVFAGASEDGEAFYKPEVSKAQDLYERNLRIKERVLDTMMATRKAKSKLDTGTTTNPLELLQEAMAVDFIIEDKPDGL